MRGRPPFSLIRRGVPETPPRMRGRPVAWKNVRRLVGNTPAYAGKTYLQTMYKPHHGKHPRVCGEDLGVQFAAYDHPETPPRMRGRPPGYDGTSQINRNTPAYAGKTKQQSTVPRKSHYERDKLP